ncbi:MAG: hypothetical protein KJP00_09265, partial [Bacteroidia bacterium]|nr:hypothetical protein [Bacteroidia bacterium]
PAIPPKSPADELEDYFRSVLNDFDEDRVKPNDISKIIKWFNFLKDRDMLVEAVEEEKTSEES